MDSVCTSCGAPARPGIIMCEFCERPVNPEAAKRAIGCRQCSTLNAENAQQCIKCKGWLVVQCLFCNAITRHDAPACGQCREPFAGAAERKAAMDAEASRQRMLQTVGAVAPIAGGLLGGVAGAFLGNSFGSSHHQSTHHHRMGGSYDSDHRSEVRNEYAVSESSSSMREMFGGDDDSSGERGGGFMESVRESFSEDDSSDDDDDNERG